MIWNQSVVPCPILTVASWPANRSLKRQVRWSGIPISFRIFQFIVIHTVKGFGIVNEAEIDVFQNVVHWRREWQTTSVFLPWEPHEQYEKCLHLEVTKSAEEIITINKTKLLDWTKLRPFFNDLNFWKVYIALSFCNHKWLSLKKNIYIYTCR